MPATKPAADRVLSRLKTHGPQSAAAVGSALDITGEAVRQQLLRLQEQQLVESAAEAGTPAGNVGRPAQLWKLTAAGHARFPDAHAVLTVRLLQAIREQFGEAALEQLIGARDSDMLQSYRQAMTACADLPARVHKLAELRSGEGYMCEWETLPDGGWLLIENHCPICAAAASCQSLCGAELRLFSAVLGPQARVERSEHLQAGARRCSYRITPA